MKKFYSLLLILFFFVSCATTKESTSDVKGKEKSKETVSVDIQTKIEKYKDNNYLVIKDKKTGKEWVIEYGQWLNLTKSYEYWNEVSSNKPTVLDVREKDGYIVVHFAYEKETGNKVFKKKERILSGYVYVPQKYINDNVAQKMKMYQGIAIGSSVYGVLTTGLIVVLLIILL